MQQAGSDNGGHRADRQPVDAPRHERPLSPHLQVYRLTFTMVLSGLHRITGLALSAGSLLLVGWLLSAALGAEAYGSAGRFFATLPVRLVLIGALLAFWYHLCAGLRHLAWDTGLGFDKSVLRKTGAVAVAMAAVASALTLAAAWRFVVASP